MSTQTPELPSTDGPIATLGRTGMNRRRFLMTSGMVAGVAAAAVACGSDGDNNETSATTTGAAEGGGSTTTTAGSGGSGGDLAVAAGAAGLEVLAVNTYGAALDAATAGDLGEVPPAVAEYATTAKKHHQDALEAWNDVLASNGEPEVSEPPADLDATVADAFGQVTDVGGVAELALMLETIAADTYLDAQASLEGADAKTLAGSIQYIDRQHIAILNFVLGEYPVPEVFQTTDESILS